MGFWVWRCLQILKDSVWGPHGPAYCATWFYFVFLNCDTADFFGSSIIIMIVRFFLLFFYNKRVLL